MKDIMKIDDILKYHPSIIHPNEMTNLIEPLKKLGISYFSHARINTKGELTTNASCPDLLKIYYQDGWYKYDLHNAKIRSEQRYFLWDAVTRVGKSEQLHEIAIGHGISHTFTILEQTEQQKDLYHFAAPPGKTYMNEFYLQHIDLLEKFVAYFKDHLLINDLLNRAYKIRCKPSLKNSGYFIREDCFVQTEEESVTAFLECINANKPSPKTVSNPSKLSRRELQCAYYLLEGRTSKDISELLHISQRTVEVYFERLKKQFDSKNKIQLAHHLTQANIFNQYCTPLD